MAQKFTIYPLGNAETCLLELNNGGKILFDYAAMNDGSETDDRFDIERETSLDKGTQRKTTENELPSLTQCTA